MDAVDQLHMLCLDLLFEFIEDPGVYKILLCLAAPFKATDLSGCITRADMLSV